MSFVNHDAIWPPIPKTIFIKHRLVKTIAFRFVLFHRDRFSNFCCPFRQQFSAAYLLKFLLRRRRRRPQRVHTALFIMCDKPELIPRLFAGVCAACMLAYRCLQFVFSSWYSGRFLQSCFCLSATWQSWWTEHDSYFSLTAHLALTAFASFLIHLLSCFGFCLLAVVWEKRRNVIYWNPNGRSSMISCGLKRFLSIDFKRALFFVFFPGPAPNYPILRLAHLFRTLLLLRFP